MISRHSEMVLYAAQNKHLDTLSKSRYSKYRLIFIKNLQLSMFISVFSVFVHENAH